MNVFVPIVGLRAEVFEGSRWIQSNAGFLLEFAKGGLERRLAALKPAFRNSPFPGFARVAVLINAAFANEKNPQRIEFVKQDAASEPFCFSHRKVILSRVC